MPPEADSQPRVLTVAEQRLIDLGNALWTDNTEAGKAYRAAAKAKYPEVRTVEDDLEPIVQPFRTQVEQLVTELSAERAQRAKEAEERATEAAERAMQNSVDAAVNQFHLTDAGRDLMLQRMKDTGNFSDPLAAAAYIVQANPPPKDPSGYLGPQNINLYGSSEESAEERVKLLHRDPSGKFLDAEFTDFLRDPDQYVRDAGLAA